MIPRIRLGMLTPSSNTVLEPTTAAMLAGVPEITTHFGRFRVTEIGLSDKAVRQFDDGEILKAAELLATARVDVIAWNGTSASWLGFDTDERLARRITEATGIRASTCVLGYRDLLRRTGVRDVGLVTPYTDDVQKRIVETWGGQGFACAAERHLGISENFAFGVVDEDEIAGMCRAVAKEGCEAVVVLCTNMRGAAIAPALESELGLPVYDSVAVTLWQSLHAAGTDPRRVEGWGRVFQVGDG